MADKTDKTDTDKSEKSGRSPMRAAAGSTRAARVQIARLVWLVCVLAALFLAGGALLVALDANRDNGLVRFVLDVARTADLGVFSRNNGILTFDGSNADTKNALFNWGIGAIAWLVVGRIAERIIRP